MSTEDGPDPLDRDRPASRTDSLSQDAFSAEPPTADWALGPFRRDPGWDFRLDGQWPDPLGVGWTSASIINPSLAVDGDDLVMAYRASPAKESMSSRIGLARRREGLWTDAGRAIVYPTLPGEEYGCEDPKLYRADGRWHLFYNAVFPVTAEDRAQHPSPGFPVSDVGCDISLAVSEDLETWEKRGPIATRAETRNWAKGAVIPRDPHGLPVRLGGEYLMFVSEGFDGVLQIGRSPDLLEWTFEPVPYLSLEPIGGGVLHEVACATLVAPDRLVLDAFYSDPSGTWCAAQFLYHPERPTTQLDAARGGTLAWGGLLEWGNRWTFAQGWDAPPGERALYLYREVRRPHR